VLGGATDALVAMEATGHYRKNLFAALVAAGFEPVEVGTSSSFITLTTRGRASSTTCSRLALA
jgi:hypothetical protein